MCFIILFNLLALCSAELHLLAAYLDNNFRGAQRWKNERSDLLLWSLGGKAVLKWTHLRLQVGESQG